MKYILQITLLSIVVVSLLFLPIEYIIYHIWGIHGGDGLSFCYAIIGLGHLVAQIGLPIYLCLERETLLNQAIGAKEKEIELKEKELRLVELENKRRNALLEE